MADYKPFKVREEAANHVAATEDIGHLPQRQHLETSLD